VHQAGLVELLFMFADQYLIKSVHHIKRSSPFWKFGLNLSIHMD